VISLQVRTFLGSLLPYADTMFNSRQTERLRKEVASRFAYEAIPGGETPFAGSTACRHSRIGCHFCSSRLKSTRLRVSPAINLDSSEGFGPS
jgi:hypothetical protein